MTSRRRVSFGILIACVLLSIGAGIGIGYAIKTVQVNSLNTEISEQEDLIKSLNLEIAQLKGEISSAIADLESKRAEGESLLLQKDSLLERVSTLEESYLLLGHNYQDVKLLYETLKAACNSSEQIIQLQNDLNQLESERNWLQSQIAALENQLVPSPNHALDRNEVFGNEKFKSIAWDGRDYQLRSKLEELAELYYSTHTYVEGETDCNDMAVDLWNMLLTENIKSVVVVGNRDMVGEEFEECDHAWLYAFDAEGMVIYMEPTTGEIFYGKLPGNIDNPDAIPYREGFIYDKPSDLWKDLKKLW